MNNFNVSNGYQYSHANTFKKSSNEISNTTTKNIRINETIIDVGNQFQKNLGKNLIAYCTENFKDFNLVNIVTALNVCAKGCQKLSKKDKDFFISAHAPLIKQLINKALEKEKLQGAKPREIAHLARTSAQLNLERGHILTSFEILAQKALSQIQNFSTQNLANTAWAFATLSIRDDKLFKAISQESLHKLPDFNSQDLANIAWAFAKLGIRDDELFKAISQESLYKLPDFNSQDLANIAWAFATLGIEDDELFEAISKEALDKIRNFTPQELANMAWAFATLGIENDELFKAISQASLDKILDFKPQELANMAWAFATLGIKNDKLFKTISQISLDKNKILDFKPLGLASTAWAFATLGIKDVALFRALSQETLKKILDFEPQELANTAGAFVILDIKDAAFFDAISKKTLEKMQDFDAHNVAHIAWALMLYSLLTSTNSYHSLLSLLIKTFDTLPEDQLSQVVASSNSKNPALRRVKILGEIYQVLLYLKYFSSEKIDPFFNLQNKITACLAEWNNFPPQSSTLHKLVRTALETLFDTHFSSEFFVEGFFLDIVLDQGKKICIEVDGPSHFLTSGEMRGNNYLKNKVLEKLGWTVFHVSYKDWDLLKNAEEKRNYLKKLLRNAPLSFGNLDSAKQGKEEDRLSKVAADQKEAPPTMRSMAEKKGPPAPVTNVWLTRGNPLTKQRPVPSHAFTKSTMNPSAREFNPHSSDKK